MNENKYPNIPQTYKGFKIGVVESLVLDMNNSPAGWTKKKTILLSKWFAKMNPPKELVLRIFEHEIKERAIALRMGGDFSVTIIGFSSVGVAAHDELMQTDSAEKESLQMYLDFIKTKSLKLYKFTMQALDSKEEKR